jgi:homoserine kinase type II
VPTVVPFRAGLTPSLLALARDRFGLRWDGEPVDVGGTNTNVRLGAHVIRVYAPWVTPGRVRFVQGLRAALRADGLPFTETAPALDGDTIALLDGRVVEVERVVEGIRMDEARQLEGALPLLARIHEALARLGAAGDAAPEVTTPAYPNHVAAVEALGWAERAAAVVGSWTEATDAERATAGRLVELATILAPLEPALDAQLVHGDFWDNNVLFDPDDADRVAAVLDLDFCGPRPRVDDLALTLYYTTSERQEPAVAAEHRARLHRLVDAYDRGLERPLRDEERRAVPLSIARTVLFMARNLVAVDDREAQRGMLEAIDVDSRWALDLARRPD